MQLSVGQLLTYVPPEWVEEEQTDRTATVKVPCSEVLRSHVPRISVAYLKSLIPPQALKIPPEVKPDAQILLEASHLALAFKVEGNPAMASETSQQPSSQKNIPSAPAASPAPYQSLSKNHPIPQEWPSPPQTLFGKLIRSIQKKFDKNAFAENVAPQPNAKNAAPPLRKGLPTKEQENFPLLSETAKSALFSSLPKLVEKGPVKKGSLRTQTPLRTQAPLQKQAPLQAQDPPPTSPPAPSQTPPPATPTPIIVAPGSVAPEEPLATSDLELIKDPAEQPNVLDQKNLILPLSHPTEPLTNEYELQKFFMTQERFSISRALDYCCMRFPEVRGCILACGMQVIATSQPIKNLDLTLLGCEIPKFMNAVAQFSKKMGLQVQGTTLFIAGSPITIFQKGDLYLLAVHESEKSSLTPGVPENLQAVLAILHRSTLSPDSKAENQLTMPSATIDHD